MTNESIEGDSGFSSRVELGDALSQYPNSELLTRVESLSRPAFAALYNEYNRGTFVFADFSLYEEDGKDSRLVISLLQEIEVTDDEAARRILAKQIADLVRG
jgi:hypothetical protein